jgi:hypothetical protein
MPNFVFVASGISNERFEKSMEVKIKSGDAVKFVPQGNQQHNGGIVSPGMSSAKAAATTPEVLNNVRFEWDQAGAEFGAEIVLVLAGKRRLEKDQADTPTTEAAA